MAKKIKILIAGGTGLIGSRLIQYLSKDNIEFCILTRSDKDSSDNVVFSKWDPDKNIMDASVLEDVDVVLNLAGAGIADKKWTKARKKILLSSRINSCNTLASYISKLSKKPKFYFGASAIGLYGDRGESQLTTNSDKGSGFLADLTVAWEIANRHLSLNFERSVILRIGIVLSTNGGALKEILKPSKAGIYGYFGSGEAYYSWIHIDDICKIISDSIYDESFSGTYNGTAPLPITIYNLVKTIKEVKGGIGVLIPVPKFGLKVIKKKEVPLMKLLIRLSNAFFLITIQIFLL